MNKSKDELLVKTFPKLYADRYGDVRQTCMSFGFECGDGWFDIIWRLSEKLESLINNCSLTCRYCGSEVNSHNKEALCNEFKPYWPRASQVKEKFGSLRMYMTCSTDEMEDAIEEAVKESSVTCEVCSKPGELRNDHGWYMTRCNDCWKEEQDLRADRWKAVREVFNDED